jgi:hypothetical protein
MADLAQDLVHRLELLHDRVATLIAQRSVDDPTAADPLRGLFLPPAAVSHLLNRRPDPVPDDDAYATALRRPEGRLLALATSFALSPLDLHILVVALAPDVSRRFEPLYGYLNDDVSRRRATVSLALELAGLQPDQSVARARFYPGSPLLAHALLTMDDEVHLPLPSRVLQVPERIVGHLLGDDTLDSALLDSVRLIERDEPDPLLDADFVKRLAGLFVGPQQTPTVVHLRERRTGSAAPIAIAALLAAEYPVLDYTCGDQNLLSALIREARLRGAAIVAGPVPEDQVQATRLISTLELAHVPVILTGGDPYDPNWSAAGRPIPLEAPAPRSAPAELCKTELGSSAEGLDVTSAVAPYRLSAEQVRRAVRSALSLSALEGRALTLAHIQQAARRQSAPLLDRHARRIAPGVGWPDLVLPTAPLATLHELVLRAQQRDRVLGDWRMRTGGGRGRGVIALFAGESGTGKTMSAEVVAGELGMDLYVVDLSAVVDKYIGETEKNLERIFTEADRSDAVLLFDEADAIFGNRSEVKDSHDKHANMQSAYLLQRLEQFDGIALLTTNLRANIDDAFTRRLDLIVDFPFPDVRQRALLWNHCLAGAPRDPQLNLTDVASRFELTGGAIHSAAVTAAYLAAGRDEMITGADVQAGASQEYRKMGRLIVLDGTGP